jgi:hypothetical protein
MERFSVHFESDPSDDEAHKLAGELKRLGATRVLAWLWVLPSDLECSELRHRLRKFRKAEDFVIEKIDRTKYRALLHMARQSIKNPSTPSALGALISLANRGRPS